ncbi:Gfo/Idh/MocA family oxidoreductase [Bacillus sp. FJAT-50079]|uniref:Gfo/Idh/MocA family protein n=1 Tax=Bacillus sp. FJAT-50079 TaxID=2833577 RepID=UPI001BCA2595|nr:Gfo/Idh/MocA family oxidoreductase [Bacillus sp. FJAT-50079]MBS4206961.1 Gfo/Idh/MocA family oxidoreductase [Bacillus sp. FJAT-50079]
MDVLEIGIVGVGGIARGRHIPAFQKLTGEVLIKGVTDVQLERAQAVAKEFDIPNVYKTYEEMLQHVDAVIICTPNKFHAELTIAAFQAGVHVFCEKPMALSVAECEEMVAAAKTAGKVLAIGYHYRSMKQVQAAKAIMESDEIGNPLVIRVQALRRRQVPGWGVFTNRELQGGGSLIDYGCHMLDLALWLVGDAEPTEVMASTYNTLSKTPGQVNQWGEFDPDTFDVDDHVTAYITFSNGASMLLETSWSNNIKEESLENVSISGDKGGLEVFPLTVNYPKHGMLFNSQVAWAPGEEDEGLVQAKNFVDACRGKREFIVKPEEALNVSKVIEAIYASSEAKTSVKI